MYDGRNYFEDTDPKEIGYASFEDSGATGL